MRSRRRFNARERFALYLAADGLCAECGTPLAPGWHADHVVPYVAGGPTDVANGQALCAACNLRKGATVEEIDNRRDWQRDAAATYFRKAARDFLLVATPGAGKTRFALGIAQALVADGTVRQLVAVVPTASLKHQWARSAQYHFGVKLDDEFLNSHFQPAPDYDGVVVTYQQVASNPLVFRRLMSQAETFVVFDEIHHAGHKSGWGAALVEGFEAASRRLCVTGTPFRSDNQRIPFVRYDVTGKSSADFSFSYADATRTRPQVCRDVYFNRYGGEIRWEDDDGVQTHVLGDDADDRTNSKAMRSALSLESRWLPEVIELADQRLLSVRENEYPDAAGLVLARDRIHAMQIAGFMEKKTGERPIVVVSDNPDDDEPSQLIKRFAEGDHSDDPFGRIPRWIVAVKMVSEGVDIPRLTVGVYATNYVTELFFRQAVGRLVRTPDEVPEVAAYMFVPSHPKLIAFAEDIASERDHVIDPVEEERANQEHSAERDELLPEYFNPLPSTVDPQGIIVSGKVYTRSELMEAKEHKRQVPSFEHFTDEYVMVLIRDLKAAGLWRGAGETVATPMRSVRQPTLSEQKKEARGRVQKLVARVVHASGAEHAEVYRQLMEIDGVQQKHATLEQLERRAEILRSWLQEERDRHAS